MKITPEISALVKNVDIFRNLRQVLLFYLLRVNKMSVIGLGGGLQERVCFSTFSHVLFCTFLYFPHFTIFSHVEQAKICLQG